MKKLRAGLIATGVAALQAFALVVVSPANAWAPPAPPDAPPRVTAPAPTTFKPPTTSVIPKSVMGRLPIGIALAIDPILGDWLRGLTGKSASPDLGCVDTAGKFHQPGTGCEAAEMKPATAPPDGMILPDALWKGITGTQTNPFYAGVAPANTTVAQLKPVFGPSTDGNLSSISIAWSGVAGDLCSAHPTWYGCGQGWQAEIGWVQSFAPIYVECKNGVGAAVGPWMGYGTGNYAKGGSTSLSGQTVAPKNFQVCAPGQSVNTVKVKAKGPQYEYAPTIAPSVWINPNKDLWAETTITSNLTCKNGSGGSVNVSASSTGTGIVKNPVCPTGYVPDSGNTSVASDLLEAPQKIEEWAIAPATRETFAECIGWSSAGCVMRVELDGVDCTPGNPACFDWAEIQRLQPSRIKCKWGTYTIDISNCMPLRNGYQSESGIASVPNQHPAAAPLSRDSLGNPVQPNADPASPPNWQPDYGTPGNPAPVPAPAQTPAPIPGYPTNPNPNPNPVPTTPDSSDTNCWPGGSAAFNPLEWVLQPVKCALSWAFVPKQATAQAQMTRIQTSLGKVGVVGAVGTVTTAITTVGGAAGSGTGCAGPTFNFDFQSVHQSMQPFNACAEPVKTMAAISNAFTTVVVIVMGLLGVVRALGASVGFGFSMGKGGGS